MGRGRGCSSTSSAPFPLPSRRPSARRPKLAAASRPAGRSMPQPAAMNGPPPPPTSLLPSRHSSSFFAHFGLIFSLLFLYLINSAIYKVSSALPQPGPCTLLAAISLPPLSGLPSLPPLPGTNAKLKCTEQGYFELVQCSDNYCVCVDPSTGAEAIATKTESNRLAPQCGRCHVQLSRYHRDSANFLFRPNCDPKTGNYISKQCKDDDHCFCVNVLNGFKLSKTEAPNGQVKCESSQFDFSIDASQIIKSEQLAGGTVVEQHIPIGNPNCKLPKDAGSRCSGGRGPISAKAVKWYFDPDTFECLAFAYNGCEGNPNRFDSVTECWDHCKLSDLAGCAGMRMPATNSQGHTIICSGLQEGTTQSCPANYRCIMLAFMGVCCHSATQDLYERNYRPVCASGGQPIQMRAGGAPANLIGKKCADEFCPSGTKCVEKEIFAHCCPR